MGRKSKHMNKNIYSTKANNFKNTGLVGWTIKIVLENIASFFVKLQILGLYYIKTPITYKDGREGGKIGITS